MCSAGTCCPRLDLREIVPWLECAIDADWIALRVRSTSVDELPATGIGECGGFTSPTDSRRSTATSTYVPHVDGKRSGRGVQNVGED
jgi:hypothetical protein